MLRLSHGRLLVSCLSHPSSCITEEPGGQAQEQVKKSLAHWTLLSPLQSDLTPTGLSFIIISCHLLVLCSISVAWELNRTPWVTLPHPAPQGWSLQPAPIAEDQLRAGRPPTPLQYYWMKALWTQPCPMETQPKLTT